MQVTTITVTRERKVQPEQYGSAGASISVAANLDDGETWQEAAKSLLDDTRDIVYGNLGLKLPGRAAKPVETKQEKAAVVVNNASDSTADVPEDPKPAATKAPAKKSPGRPATKKAAEPVPSEDIPGEDVPEIRKNPEDRKDPASDVPDDKPAEAAAPSLEDEFPDEPEADPVGNYSVEDLQSFLTSLVKDKKVSAQKVREIISSHGVARTSDLPADKVLTVKKQIEAACG